MSNEELYASVRQEATRATQTEDWLRQELAEARAEIERLLTTLSVAKDEAEAQRVLRGQQRERAEKAEAEIERLKEWQRQMVEKAAEKSLDGYRELAARLAQRDEEIERLRSENHRLLAEKSNGRITEAQIAMVEKWSGTAQGSRGADYG